MKEEPEKIIADKPVSKVPRTEGQKYILQAFSAKRFHNGTQADTVRILEDAYGMTNLRSSIDWAAKSGMPLGRGIIAIEKALPNWNDRNNGKKKNGSTD